jgi:hypothetical protein
MSTVWAWVMSLLSWEGSTRAVGLARIGLVLTMWARFASSVRPFDDMRTDRLLLSAAFFLVTPLMFVGLWTRVVAPINAALLLVLYFVYGFGLFGAGEVEMWSHHHVYAMVVFGVLLAMTPCGRSFSIDRWFDVRRAERQGVSPPPESGPLWATSLITLQLVMMYLWTAWDKTFWGFVNGDRLGMMAAELYSGGSLPDAWWFSAALAVMGTVTLVVEWVLPIALPFARTHRWSVPLGLALHAVIYVSVPVATYTVTMWLYYLITVRPDVVHRALDVSLGYSSLAAAPTHD